MTVADAFAQFAAGFPGPLQLVRPDGHVEHANAAAGKLLGASRDLSELVREPVAPFLARAAASTRPVDVELTPRDSDVTWRVSGWCVAPDAVVLRWGPADATERFQTFAVNLDALGGELYYHRQLEADLRRRGVDASEQERRRWARELHDGTLQDLAALKLRLGAALRDGSPEALREAVADVREQLGIESDNLRALISELRPAALDALGLEAALRALVRHVSETADVTVALDWEGAQRLAPEIETTIYRIVQEALRNVVNHARAEQARVTIRTRDAEVELLVTDEGEGFDPDAPATGWGLAGMRERAELVGGTLSVVTSSRGTVVTATVPRR